MAWPRVRVLHFVIDHTGLTFGHVSLRPAIKGGPFALCPRAFAWVTKGMTSVALGYDGAGRLSTVTFPTSPTLTQTAEHEARVGHCSAVSSSNEQEFMQ